MLPRLPTQNMFLVVFLAPVISFRIEGQHKSFDTQSDVGVVVLPHVLRPELDYSRLYTLFVL